MLQDKESGTMLTNALPLCHGAVKKGYEGTCCGELKTGEEDNPSSSANVATPIHPSGVRSSY